MTYDAATTNRVRLRRAPARRAWLLLPLCYYLVLAAWFAPRQLAQSGRRQAPASAKDAPAPQRPRTVTPVPPPDLTPTSAAAQPAPAATGKPEEVDEDEVVRVTSNLVPVPASVIDAQGRAVTDLGAEDFQLLVDGELKPVADVSRAETPVRMAVLFDNSSSQRATRELEKRAAVQFFKSVMRPIDQAALYSVSTEPLLVLPLTSDTRALTRIVEHFPPPEGATALFDAIVMAAEYLRPHAQRKVIVIVSDGAETTSRLEDFDEVLRRAQAADCQIFAVQTRDTDNPNLRDLVAERRLQVLAAETGGAVYVPRAASDLERAFAQIAADLAQQYVLSYYPTDQRRDGRFHTFSVKVVSRPDARVRTRRGYYAPKG